MKLHLRFRCPVVVLGSPNEALRELVLGVSLRGLKLSEGPKAE